MPPKQRVKRSFNVEPEAIAILKAYADAAHQGNQTEALNAIILASANTHIYNAATQVPPRIATQDSQAYWQKAIEARLTKLETATQVPPIIATQANPSKPKYSKGDVIDSRSKVYQQLRRSFEAKQKVDGTTYLLSNELNVVCVFAKKSRSDQQKYEVWQHFPNDKMIINEDGTFLKDLGGQIEYTLESELTTRETNNEQTIEVVSTVLEQPKSAVELSSDEISIDAVTEAPTPQNEPLEEVPTQVPPMTASTEELLARFATKPLAPSNTKTLRDNLSTIKMVKLQDGWTAQHDPDGLAWIPTDETRKHWVELPAVAAK